MRKVLGPDFFDRPALAVAKDLVGKYLVRKTAEGEAAYMIMETEAYFGLRDKGSHAHRGQTPRNAPMFGPAGTIYVYFTYGMHWMLNLVVGKSGYPAAVLIRGLEASPEKASSPALRAAKDPSLTVAEPFSDAALNGPAKLTKFLQIDKSLNGLPLGKKSGLWVEDRGVLVSPKLIQKTPRIGIPGRGEWTDKPWRFVLIRDKENRKGRR
jgi:DNA-3-methyladenine glycosylase